MKTAVFSAHPYELPYFQSLAQEQALQLTPFDVPLNPKTASIGYGYSSICCFVNDNVNDQVLHSLAQHGLKHIALRCAGFNNIDINVAKQLGISISRVPKYSPYAVAEFAVTLILALNRKIVRACQRIRDHNFTLNHLLGFDLHGKTVGVIGTGHIGEKFAKIMLGFGCKVIAYDIEQNQACIDMGVTYVKYEELLQQSHIISLHCPLNEQTKHIINAEAIQNMRDGVMLINTGRGGLVDTHAVIDGLRSLKIGYLGIDVYEEEEKLFFEDHTEDVLADEQFAILQAMPNVIITGHQAFFTHEALTNIADTTIANLLAFYNGSPQNLVS